MSSPASMLDRVAGVCLQAPEREAFHIRDRFYSYAAFASRIATIRSLIERDAGSEMNVGVVAYDDLDTYAAIFAVWFAGQTMVPIGPAHPPERNGLIMRSAGLRVVLSSRNDAEIERLRGVDDARFVFTAEADDGERALTPPVAYDLENPAYILFTSGSTGTPKGVPISHRALEGFLGAFEELGLGLGADDRFLQMFDLTFDLSLMSYCVPLTLGACVYTVPSDVVRHTYLYRLLDEQRLTCALMVPSILARLRPYFGEIRLPDLRVSLFCGEALYDDLLTEWIACAPNARVLNVYGPTEATIFCTTYERPPTNAKALNGIVSIGKAMVGVGVSVVDDADRALPAGQKGELCLSGRQLTNGYWNDAERSASRFFSSNGETWYRTGDVCVFDEDGDLSYLGRVDQQVKVQGYRVELSEIEHHVRSITGLRHVAAVAAVGTAGETSIHLFLEAFTGSVPEMLAVLRAKVPTYMLPARTTTLDALPLNANGKIDRRMLESKVRDTSSGA